jgi:hypothetical protein
MIIKCKICGKEIEVADDDKLRVCIGGTEHITEKQIETRLQRRKNG